ncbi:MAG: LysM peptidoglycan-binding domain-containing protein [Planctomycetota bacterium]
MARETKVGLLAGLAFIVCFAVILANRGQREFAALGSLPVDWQRGMGEKPGGGATPKVTPVVTAFRGHAPVVPNGTPTFGSGQNPSDPHETPTNDAVVLNGIRDAAVSRTNQTPAGTKPTSVPPFGPREQTLEELAATFGGSNSAQPAANGDPVQKLPGGAAKGSGDLASPQPKGRKYAVASGDTLSKIAFVHYGSRSQSIVKSICDANPTVLPNPDELRVGVVLVLPELAQKNASPGSNGALLVSLPEKQNTPGPGHLKSVGDSKASSTSPTGPGDKAQSQVPSGKSRAARTEKSDKGSESGIRWYEVKKGDRYASIARQLLGDSGRWKEIHELNKDRIVDPQTIREGIKIKLPEAVRAESRSRRK